MTAANSLVCSIPKTWQAATGEVFVGKASAARIEAPNALDRLTYDVDENRIDGFSEDGFVRSQPAAWDGAPELWAVPTSPGEVSLGASARFTSRICAAISRCGWCSTSAAKPA